MSRALDLDLYLVAGPTLCRRRGLLDTVAAAVSAGVTLVQLREPEATTRELCRLGEALQEVLADAQVPLVINDRVDVALAIGAAGVHLGQSDLDVRVARRLVGDELVIGLSVSTLGEVAEADRLPAGTVDHLGLGPVFQTATKPEAAQPLGLAGTAALRAATSLPCVAIGGIGATNIEHVWATGVDGVAVASAICAADDPAVAAARLRRPSISRR